MALVDNSTNTGATGTPGRSAYPTLFSPGVLGPLRTANRIILSPMTRTSATPDGRVTAQMAD